MTANEKYLQAFPLFADSTFDEFCLNIPKFYFKKEVPEDVIRNFEIVEKLLVHSYFEYKFIDEAYEKAIRSFEMAMVIRYRELNLPPKKMPGFDFLIKELTALNLFDTDLETLKQVKDTRNRFSHPEMHTFGGAFYWNRIEFISRLVNEMYEDVTLRDQRRDLVNDFISMKKDLNLDQFLLMKNHLDETTIVYRLNLLWINNKLTPPTYLLQCVPLFDLTSEGIGQGKCPPLYGLTVVNPTFSNGQIVATDIDNMENVSFTSIDAASNENVILHKWQSGYDAIQWNFMYDNSINMFSSSLLVPALKAFQEL